jgi:uncharacterized protein YbaR (Trm112 family)
MVPIWGVLEDFAMIKQELIDILACPKCKGPVEFNQEHNGLLCRFCQLLYPIREDIPIMLIDEAQPLPAPEK